MNSTSVPGPARLLAGDAIIGFLLANEIRHRVVESVFGVAREDSNRMTAIAIGVAGDGAQGAAARVLAAPVLPSAAVAVLGAAAVRETVHAIAGDASSAIPRFGTLMAVAVVGTATAPLMRSSLHGMRRSFRGMRRASHAFRSLIEGSAPRPGSA